MRTVPRNERPNEHHEQKRPWKPPATARRMTPEDRAKLKKLSAEVAEKGAAFEREQRAKRAAARPQRPRGKCGQCAARQQEVCMMRPLGGTDAKWLPQQMVVKIGKFWYQRVSANMDGCEAFTMAAKET